MGTNKITFDVFVERARKIHGDFYTYKRTNYIGHQNYMNIICPKHGIFSQLPVEHTKGRGCMKCSVEKRTSTTPDFIEKSKKIHGDLYDYSLVEYEHSHGYVKIICQVH